MPELPEVQTTVDDLISHGMIGRTIEGVLVTWPRSIGSRPTGEFRRLVVGGTVQAIRRRGKYIVWDLGPRGCLLIHLRMSGRLHIVPSSRPRDKHEHVVFRIGGRRDLRFHDTRKFGRVLHLADESTVLGRLGPEPLARSFTAGVLGERLAPRRRAIKPLLLDQSFLAGLGNIYVDEALWGARIHPLRPASSIDADGVRALHRAIRQVLRLGLRYRGTSLGDGEPNYSSMSRRGDFQRHLKVFRRTGCPCPRCKGIIERRIVAQRSTHFCARCQKL